MTLHINNLSKVKLLVFLLLFLSNSFVVTNQIFPSVIVIILWIVFFLFTFQRKLQVNTTMIVGSLFLITTMWVSFIYNNDNLLRACNVTFAIICTVLLVNHYDFETFNKAYREVMFFLSLISIVLFLLYLLIPSLTQFLAVHNNSGRLYSNLVLFVYSKGLIRNSGMFWEPGAFQTFISIALLFEILKDQRIEKISVYIIALITTFSTTGFLSLFLLILIMYTHDKDSTNKNFLLAFLVLIGVCLGWYFTEFLFSTESTSVFGKLLNFISKEQYLETYSSHNSATVRYFSVVKPFSAFLEVPFIGMCHKNLIDYTYSFTYGMNTCTFINWFAMYGIIYGSIMIVGYKSFTRLLTDEWLTSFLVILLLLIVISTENYVDNCSISVFCFYGLRYLKVAF